MDVTNVTRGLKEPKPVIYLQSSDLACVNAVFAETLKTVTTTNKVNQLYIPRRTKNVMFMEELITNVHSSIIHNN